jgi:hypothetical protein
MSYSRRYGVEIAVAAGDPAVCRAPSSHVDGSWAFGRDEPVFQRGELVGHVRRYDSRLLEMLLRARDPARFRESVQVNAGGEVTFVLDSLLERARRLEAPEPVPLANTHIGELESPGPVER